ncbi:MAG: hypothetical protein P4L84_24380 [Isosphaeraceae bacterium]|nr:hypothetical protein [Isosphaeraceae bacterium]
MAKTIAINGIRLDEVRMPLEPQSPGVVSFLSYPMGKFRLSRNAANICLVLPACVSVELYRTGILPQDTHIPVEISIGGRSAGRYVVSDVRYPMRSDSPLGEVTFTLTRVLPANARETSRPPLLRPEAAGIKTYVTDITHYLDETGEVAPMPGPARKLASFLTLLIEAATGAPSPAGNDSGIRCRTKACRGSIRTSLPSSRNEISWHCPICGHNGVIRNWNNTKWNQLNHPDEHE